MTSSDSILDQILEKGCTVDTFCAVLSHAKENGQASEVIKACLKALDVHPHHIPLRRLLAETCLEMGFMGLAEDEFKTLGSYIDDLALVYMPLAELYLKQKRPEDACRALELYLAHYPDDEEARKLFENTRTVGDSLEVKEQEVMELAEALKAEILEDEEDKMDHESIKEDLLLADSEIDKEDLMEISTPTLAEIYFNQGQIHEAINIYEKVLTKYPEDRASMKRLTELKASLQQSTKDQERPETELTRKKEKMVSVLESWLSRLQET